MATLDHLAIEPLSEPEPTPSASPTPPPIPSSSNRRSSRKSLTKTINNFYDDANQSKQTGTLVRGAPTKQTRLLEYFLVISYGESLKLREKSPLMDIFDHYQRRVHHHHAYIVHPQHKHRRRKSSKLKHKDKGKHHKRHKSNADEHDEKKQDDKLEANHQHNTESSNKTARSPPKTPPPPKPDNANEVDGSLNEQVRTTSADDLQRTHSASITGTSNAADNPFSALRFEPCVVDRFPPLDHEDTALISTDTQLHHFCLPTGLFLTKFPSLPIFYTFVWTPETGDHLYGCCLRFFEPVEARKIYEFCQAQTQQQRNEEIEDEQKEESKTAAATQQAKSDKHVQKEDELDPFVLSMLASMTLADCKGYYSPKCICIISYHSFIDGYRTFLTELYRLSLTPNSIPIERYLCNFFLECPLPPRGYFSVEYQIGDKSFVMARAPSNDPLSKSPVSTRILFELFTIDAIMNIYKAMLMEEKILFISTQYSILSIIAEIFVSLMYPFNWPHVYIPLLPEDFLAFLKAPTVFLIGTHKSLLLQIGDDLDDDILIVDINNGSVQHGFQQYKLQQTAGSAQSSHIEPINESNELQPPPVSAASQLSVSYGNSSMNIDLPKHEKSKLVKFLTPVSTLLYGSHQHDFHQLDLAFPVAPTPDMIEEQEQLQEKRLQKMKSQSSSQNILDALTGHHHDKALKKHRSGSTSLSHNSEEILATDHHLNNENQHGNESPAKPGSQKRKFSLNFRFKRPNLSKMSSLSQIGMSLRSRSDSIEPPLKSYVSASPKTPETPQQTAQHVKSHSSHSQHSRSHSSSSNHTEFVPLKKKSSGNLDDIVESPINAIFDDAAVRNGFLRFWLSIFRSYQECIVRPNSVPPPPPNAATLNVSEPIYEHSATKTLDTNNPNVSRTPDPDDGGMTTEDEDATAQHMSTPQHAKSHSGLHDKTAASASPKKKRKNSLSKSMSSVTSSFNSGTQTGTHTNSQQPSPLMFGQSVDSIFDEEKFLKSSPSQSRPFLSIFLQTEAFHRFITKCVFNPEDSDVRYFNEKIVQKLGRSRFTKAQPTPFLNNKDYVISHQFRCPSPYISDLDGSKKYIYPEWPKLNPSLYTKARRKYATMSKSSKDTITTNYMQISHNDEPSITYEPSKSQTITSTIISPPRGNKSHTNNITPHEKEQRNRLHDDNNIIREADEEDDGEFEEEKHDQIVLQLGGIDAASESSNPFSHDRVTYHLWFYIFLRTLQPNTASTDSQQRALHLMIKIMAQMKNENVGLPDQWVFLELIEAMSRMKWAHHVVKLVEVMNKLQYKLDSTIYSALLNVLTKQYGNLETAYNILGNLPSKLEENQQIVNSNISQLNLKENRRNSLLMNCDVKPETSRKKYYETINELKNRFSLTFPGRSIIIKQQCPLCSEAVHDVHIRLGWPKNDQSFDTQCPNCSQRFPAKFLIRESETYSVWFHETQSLRSLKFFTMRAAKGVFVKDIDIQLEKEKVSIKDKESKANIQKQRENAITNTISIGDQIIGINGHNVSNHSLDEIYEMLKNPPSKLSHDLQQESVNNKLSVNAHAMKQSATSPTPSEGGDDSVENEQQHDTDEEMVNGPPPPPPPPKKISLSTAKLMSFMKFGGDKKKLSDPVCLTFQRVILCPYFSPLILYREIKKLIQSHALSLSASASSKEETGKTGNQADSKSYRESPVKGKDKEEIQKLLLQSGISAISSVEFRVEHSELFWNLAWHFSNLRLPIHFLQSAFEDMTQIHTPSIDELIHFIPLELQNENDNETAAK